MRRSHFFAFAAGWIIRAAIADAGSGWLALLFLAGGVLALLEARDRAREERQSERGPSLLDLQQDETLRGLRALREKLEAERDAIREGR
jgi:hypothetical protein